MKPNLTIDNSGNTPKEFVTSKITKAKLDKSDKGYRVIERKRFIVFNELSDWCSSPQEAWLKASQKLQMV